MYAALVYIVKKHEFIQRNAALQLCCPPRPCGSSDVLGSHVRCREAALLVSVGAREHGTAGGHAREVLGLSPWAHGALQHRSACLLTAHRPVNAAREVREATERHAAGAGRVRAVHVHHVAPHLVADDAQDCAT